MFQTNILKYVWKSIYIKTLLKTTKAIILIMPYSNDIYIPSQSIGNLTLIEKYSSTHLEIWERAKII
jgi:hypothetical protein